MLSTIVCCTSRQRPLILLFLILMDRSLIQNNGTSEDAVVLLLVLSLVLRDVVVAVGELGGAASMENREDDISSSPSQLPPKGMKRSTTSFASFTSSAGISIIQEYCFVDLDSSYNGVKCQFSLGIGTHLLARLIFQLRVLYGYTHRSTLAVSQLGQYNGNQDARSAVQAMSYLLLLTTISFHLGWSQ